MDLNPHFTLMWNASDMWGLRHPTRSCPPLGPLSPSLDLGRFCGLDHGGLTVDPGRWLGRHGQGCRGDRE